MMPTVLTFDVPGCPPKHTLQASRGICRTARGVRCFTRKPARLEMAQMREAFAARLPDGWTPRTEPCRVTVDWVYPLRRGDKVRDDGELLPHSVRPDADGIWKGCGDSMNGLVYADDGQIFSLTVRKWRGARPRWRVVVEFMEAVEKPRRRSAMATTTPPGNDGQGRLF